ncbi:hypothetical protein ALP39_03164 [Pseudomonas marginalis pv. marginalis]|nr:hypothetical protein ALP39_03164 [Pseudomonas marginalis pv. marginalis]
MTALLTNNLPLLAGAPNGIKKLRELILELAVRGQLVTQQSEDLSAKSGLDASRTARVKAMADGKVKKEKPAVEVTNNEQPFRLPCGWVWCRIVDTGDYINGLAFKPSDWSSIGRPIIRIQNLSGRNSEFNRTEREVDSSVVVSPGDILVSWSATLDAFIWQGEQAVLNQHIFRVIPSSVMHDQYLYWLLKWAIKVLADSDHAHGLVMAHINRGPFLAQPVGLPPLAEQHRIVAKVDELMALCDRLEAQQADAESAHAQLVQALLDSLTQASDATDFAASWQRLAEHFHTLFTTEFSIDTLKQTLLQLAVMGKLAPQDPNDEPANKLLGRIVSDRQQLANEGRFKKQKNLTEITEEEKLFAIPQNWEWARISSFSELKSGLAYKSEAFSEVGKNQVIRMGNIRPGMLRLETNPAFISNDLARDTFDFSLVAGDIVLTMTGTKGKQDYMYSVLIEEKHLEKSPLFLNQRLCAIRTQYINQKFLTLILQDQRLLDPIFRSSTGTANQANIGMSALNNWALPIPPLAEQNRIVNAADQVMNICEAIKIKISTSYNVHNLISSALIVEGLA